MGVKMSENKEFDEGIKKLQRSMKALYLCLEESVANDVNERINFVMNGYQEIIDKKDAEIKRIKAVLTRVIDNHCENCNLEETISMCREALSEVENE